MKLKAIPGFRGYFAGPDGNIYSYWGRGTSRKISTKYLHKLSPGIQTTGRYFVVSIKSDDKIRKTYRVHRLVCVAFHGLPKIADLTASHLDGNWKNNKPDNLKWESYSENHNRKKIHGTDDIGVKNSRSLINLRTLRQIRLLLSQKKLTHKQIGEKFGLQRLFITKIANGYRYNGQG